MDTFGKTIGVRDRSGDSVIAEVIFRNSFHGTSIPVRNKSNNRVSVKVSCPQDCTVNCTVDYTVDFTVETFLSHHMYAIWTVLLFQVSCRMSPQDRETQCSSQIWRFGIFSVPFLFVFSWENFHFVVSSRLVFVCVNNINVYERINHAVTHSFYRFKLGYI